RGLSNLDYLPILELSGNLEGRLMRDQTADERQNLTNNSQIKYTAAELDFLFWVNKYVVGYFQFAPNTQKVVAGSTLSFMDVTPLSFITFGNFNTMPIYGTLGQLYAPFGSF